MKILYIHQYFITPERAGGTRSYWLSKELINDGHEVVMLTSAKKGQDKFLERKNVDGISVISIRSRYSEDMGVALRLWSFFKFMLYSTWIGLKQKDIDIVYATSTPLSVAVPAMVIKWFKGIPFIFEVRDLWPEVPIQMGAIKNKILIKLLYKFEKKIYTSAKHIVALSPGMYDGIIKYGISPDKVSMVPNMSKKDEFFERPKNASIARRFGLDPANFHAIHFGSIGASNGVDYIINAARILKKANVSNVKIILMGWGTYEEKFRKMCEQEALTNVLFLGYHPMNITSEVVNICDVSIVSFANIPILYTNSPNKLFDSLSAAKPVIVNSPGWTKKMVEDNNCGLYVNPENPEELANALISLSKDPERIKILSENSRNLAENTYDKSILCRQLCNIISKYDNTENKRGYPA